MRSKSIIIALILSLFFTACSDKSIPRHQTTMPEGSEQQDSSGEVKEFAEFNDEHNKIGVLIDSKDEDNLTQALNLLEAQLFTPQAQDSLVYTASEYIGYVNLYVKLFKVWEGLDKNTAFSEKFNSSLAAFKAKFIDSCTPEIGDCELVKTVLKKDKSTVAIILYFAGNEADKKVKLNLLGVAYDAAGRRKEQRLEEMYIEAVLSIINDKGVLEEKSYTQHSQNLMYILSSSEWENIEQEKVKLFKTIEPWKYQPPRREIIDYLRADMISLIPLYAKADESINNSIKEEVTSRINSISRGKEDLSTYPAYSNINLEKFKSEDPIAGLLLLDIYFNSMEDSGAYLLNIEDKATATETVYKLSRDLVRWDIAQLSIDSTNKLAERFSQQEVKTKDFVQDTVDFSKTLVPLWTAFHSNRLATLSKFLNSNKQHFKNITDKEVADFFDSINRNILKTTVYPNMLAFMHHMAKTEWKATIQVFIWSISLDTRVIFDFMMTGQYFYPWFNFVNLKDDPGYSNSTKKSLFRSEILDSIYYLFATKTHEKYKVDSDEFVTTVATTLFKKRMARYEQVLDFQDRIYFDDNSIPNQLVRWCDSIREGTTYKEVIPFYDLYMYNTPITASLGTVLDYNGAPDIADLAVGYNDLYRTTTLSSFYTRVSEENDRMKQEYMPIMQTVSQVIGIIERLKQSNAGLIGSLEESKKYYAQMDRFQKVYLGSQMTIRKKMGDCPLIASEESRRRARTLGFYEYKYMHDIAYPLLQKVIDKELSADEANEFLRRIHGNHRGFLDQIIYVNENVINYKLSRMGYMLRARQFLINGMVAEHEALSEKIVFEPVVGSNLSIPIPSSIFDDARNPYFNTNGNLRYYRDLKFARDQSADEFAGSAVVLATDELSNEFLTDKYSRWDKKEGSRYLSQRNYFIQQLVQWYQMGNFEYYDLNDPNCRNYLEEIPAECKRVNDVTLDTIAQEMVKSYEMLELDAEKLEYLKLIGNKSGYMNLYTMDMVLKLDTNAIYDFNSSSLPYIKQAGLFDYPFDMLRADYLGEIYMDEADLFIMQQSGSSADVTCEGNRDNCYWKNEKIRATEYYYARKLRQNIIFNFDKKILEENYDYLKSSVARKFNLLQEIEDRGEELVEKYWGDREYVYDLNKPAASMYPLSISKSNSKADREKFFKETTGRFYISDPNWDEYLDNE